MFRLALGARHRERGLEITNNSRLLGRVTSSCVIKNFKFDSLNFQGIHIEQDDFSRLFEFWYSDQSYRLSRRTINNRRFESWLIAHEINVRTLFDDELVFVLKRIAPCIVVEP